MNINSNDEVVLKLIGKITLEFEEFEDFSKQLKLKETIEEILYNYDVVTKETNLATTDLPEKIQLFLACKKLEGLNFKTLRNYNSLLKDFSTFLIKPVIAINVNDIRIFLANATKGLKETTHASKVSILKSFFKWLYDEEYIRKNPMLKIKMPKVPKRLRKALTEEQLEKLRLACETDREKALIEFGFASAMRVSELASVNITDIDWQDMSLKIIGKGNKERKVYFSTKAKIFLEKYINSRPSNQDALFINSKKPFNRLSTRALQKEVEKIRKRAGFENNIKVTPHILRHTKATIALNKGAELITVQKILGHEDPSTTLIYAHMNDENLKAAYKRIS